MNDIQGFIEFLGWHPSESQFNVMYFKDGGVQAVTITNQSDIDRAEDFITKHNGTHNLYVSLNPLKVGSRATKPQNIDVVTVRNVYIDIDRAEHDKYRCKDTPADDTEIAALKRPIKEVKNVLTKMGVVDYLHDFTGNGYRFIIPVDNLPIIQVGETKDGDSILECAEVKGFLRSLKDSLGFVDPAVSDPARVTGIPGTLNVKPHEHKEIGRVNRTRDEFKPRERKETSSDVFAEFAGYVSPTKPQATTKTPQASSTKLSLDEAIEIDDKRYEGKLRRLINGDISGYKSRSEAEMAIANKLVFYNFNEALIGDILVNISGSKASEKRNAGHEDWIITTVQKAFATTTARYNEFSISNMPDINIEDLTTQLADMHISENTAKNARSARKFIQEHMMGMNNTERTAFIEGNVRKHFNLSHKSVVAIIKSVNIEIERIVKKAATRDQKYEIKDRYFVKNVFRKADNGLVLIQEPLCNFYIDLKKDTMIDDGIEQVRRWEGSIHTDNIHMPFNAEAVKCVTIQDFARVLAACGGSRLQFESNNLQDIRLAMQEISDPEHRNIRQTFGMDGKSIKYETPSVHIGIDGIHLNETDDIDLSTLDCAENLDIQIITDDEFKAVGRHIIKDLMHIQAQYVVNCLVGHTFMSPFVSSISSIPEWTGERIGLWLLGTTGCGKSYTATKFQHFFGNFSRSLSIPTWAGTPYSLQKIGYYYNDALLLIDDFKIGYFRGNRYKMASMIEVLQNYTDSRARSRLKSDMSMQRTYYIRGNLVITGEDLPDNEASIMGRYHIIRVQERDINHEAGRTCAEYQHLYSGFMGRYIQWVISREDYAAEIVTNITKLKDWFRGDRTTVNIDRIAQSFAFNLTGYEMFCQFMCDSEFIDKDTTKDMISNHKNDLDIEIDSLATFVHSSTASIVFLSALSDLINSGQCKIHDSKDVKTTHNPDFYYDENGAAHETYDIKEEIPIEDMINCIGFDVDEDDQYLYLFPDVTYREVVKLLRMSEMPFNHTKHSLTTEMEKVGCLIPGKKQAATQKKYQGKNRKVWKITKKSIDYMDVSQTIDWGGDQK